jgi:choline monooxygenase
MGPVKNAENKAYKVNSNAETDKFIGWWLWPTTTINTNPGSPNMLVFHWVPTGPDTAIEYFDFYFQEKEPDEEGWALIRYFDEELNPEDIPLIESCQRGLSSKGYTDARYIVDKERTEISENALHHFHGLVLKAMEE